MYSLNDTIAAVSTPLGEGGIGIVRLSGPRAVTIVSELFVGGPAGRPTRTFFESHRLYYGHIVDPTTVSTVDEVIVSTMRTPRSYTREDVVEINCHGGPVPLQKVLGLCLRHGARQAEPGEFTLRAFVNGRLDLSQAEAVLDVVQAKTEASLRAAVGQLGGHLSHAVRQVRQIVLEMLAYLAATIDFTEQEIPLRDIGPSLKTAQKMLQELLADADRGMIYRHGVRAVIVGRPNAGKSSILNALLRANRAIVTPVPGTTRDTLEETINLRGVPVVLVDTAGLNDQAQDLVERLGIERSRLALDQADLVLLVIDGSQPLAEVDWAITEGLDHRPVLVVINKVDLPCVADMGDLLPSAPRAQLSALTGEGLHDLEDAMLNMILGGEVLTSDAPLVSNLRHKEAIERALSHLGTAQQTYERKLPADFVAIDLTAACDALGEITGETVAEDLLETIFSHFCIGK
jgi:tRNA modification GTPase